MALPQWACAATPDGRFAAANGSVGRGLSLNFISAIAQLGGALLTTIVLSRILTPDDFGVYGMILPFATALMLVADGGGIYYMLRSKEVSDRVANGLFWYSTGCGFLSMAALLIALPFISWVMDEPRLIAPGAAVAVAVLIQSMGAIHSALMLRCFRNDLRTLCYVAGVIVSITAATGLAVAGFGYWALFAALTLRNVVAAVLFILVSRWLPAAPSWDRPLISDILRLARPELRSRILMTMICESDKILIGVLYSTSAAGVYAFAQMLSVAPLIQIMAPTIIVIIPWLAEYKDDASEVFSRFRATHCGTLYVVLAPCVFGALFADYIFKGVLGENMQSASGVFRILILAAAMRVVYSSAAQGYQALDRPDILERQHRLLALIYAVCLGVAALFGAGHHAIAFAVLTGATAGYAWRLYSVRIYFRGTGQPFLSEVLRCLITAPAPALLLWFAAWCAGGDLSTGHAFADLMIFSALFGALYILAGCLLFRITPRNFLAKLREMKRSGKKASA